MTPQEWLSQIEGVIEQMALLYAHTPDEAVEKSLAGFLERTRAQWVGAMAPLATPEQVGGLVEDLGRQIQARRREIDLGTAPILAVNKHLRNQQATQRLSDAFYSWRKN